MVSEDSDQLVPGFTPIHRLHDLDDLHETRPGRVLTAGHEFDARSELLEVEAFGGSQRMFPEERDDPLEQILATMNGVAVEVLPVVVMPPVDVHLAHSKELA